MQLWSRVRDYPLIGLTPTSFLECLSRFPRRDHWLRHREHAGGVLTRNVLFQDPVVASLEFSKVNWRNIAISLIDHPEAASPTRLKVHDLIVLHTFRQL
jgi:hypothetical protein